MYELLGTRDNEAETAAAEEALALCKMAQEAYVEFAKHNYKQAIIAYSQSW